MANIYLLFLIQQKCSNKHLTLKEIGISPANFKGCRQMVRLFKSFIYYKRCKMVKKMKEEMSKLNRLKVSKKSR